jgi:hypothetical protein
MVVVGCRHTRCLGNVVMDFVATVRKLVRRLIRVLASGTATCVLRVCVDCFHQRLEVLFGEYIVGLDGGGLLLPIKHYVLVEVVAVVHLLQVKLEFVFVRDCYAGADKRALVVVEAIPKGGEMFITIPLGVVCVFQCFLCLDVKGAPVVVQMFQYLEGSDVAVRREAMLQLGLVMFLKGIT